MPYQEMGIPPRAVRRRRVVTHCGQSQALLDQVSSLPGVEAARFRRGYVVFDISATAEDPDEVHRQVAQVEKLHRQSPS